MLRKFLCLIGFHSPEEKRIEGSCYEYDMVCTECRHCGRQLTAYEPR